MTSNAFSGVAAAVVLTFLVMALMGCANSGQSAVVAIPAEQPQVAQDEPGTAEFHGAHIANDFLRDRLPSES